MRRTRVSQEEEAGGDHKVHRPNNSDQVRLLECLEPAGGRSESQQYKRVEFSQARPSTYSSTLVPLTGSAFAQAALLPSFSFFSD